MPNHNLMLALILIAVLACPGCWGKKDKAQKSNAKPVARAQAHATSVSGFSCATAIPYARTPRYLAERHRIPKLGETPTAMARPRSDNERRAYSSARWYPHSHTKVVVADEARGRRSEVLAASPRRRARQKRIERPAKPAEVLFATPRGTPRDSQQAPASAPSEQSIIEDVAMIETRPSPLAEIDSDLHFVERKPNPKKAPVPEGKPAPQPRMILDGPELDAEREPLAIGRDLPQPRKTTADETMEAMHEDMPPSLLPELTRVESFGVRAARADL